MPLLIDSMRRVAAESWEGARQNDAHAAREFLLENAIVLTSDEELWLIRLRYLAAFSVFARYCAFCQSSGFGH